MRRIRVIPTLLLDGDGGLVKTIKFNKRTYIGDPINAVKIFNDKGVDELLLLDIDATVSGRDPNFELVEEIASEAFMPIGYGGGIRDVEQMHRLFRCGLEKVVLSTNAHQADLISAASEKFGAQSIVACLDIKRTVFGGYKLTTTSGTKSLKVDPVKAARQAVEAGAGELIVHSIHRDGTYQGYDDHLLQMITNEVSVPVVACGGARDIDDFYNAVANCGCSAVAAGSMFVYQGASRGVLISYPNESKLNQFYQRLGA